MSWGSREVWSLLATDFCSASLLLNPNNVRISKKLCTEKQLRVGSPFSEPRFPPEMWALKSRWPKKNRTGSYLGGPRGRAKLRSSALPLCPWVQDMNRGKSSSSPQWVVLLFENWDPQIHPICVTLHSDRVCLCEHICAHVCTGAWTDFIQLFFVLHRRFGPSPASLSEQLAEALPWRLKYQTTDS